MVSRYSSIKPFSVFGVSVGNFQFIARRGGDEFPDNFFEYGLETNDTLSVDIFIDNQCKSLLGFLQLRQLCIQWRAFRHEVGVGYQHLDVTLADVELRFVRPLRAR